VMGTSCLMIEKTSIVRQNSPPANTRCQISAQNKPRAPVPRERLSPPAENGYSDVCLADVQGNAAPDLPGLRKDFWSDLIKLFGL
ncbi:MAG: hypothetical protein NXI02_29130, partial [Rhodobacteraceae bacterium]|nr:hypothetical protein [Paracoccaceae bacterium]